VAFVVWKLRHNPAQPFGELAIISSPTTAGTFERVALEIWAANSPDAATLRPADLERPWLAGWLRRVHEQNSLDWSQPAEDALKDVLRATREQGRWRDFARLSLLGTSRWPTVRAKPFRQAVLQVPELLGTVEFALAMHCLDPLGPTPP